MSFQFTRGGEGKPRELLTSVPGKIMKKFILGTTERHLNVNAIVWHRECVHKGKVLFN